MPGAFYLLDLYDSLKMIRNIDLSLVFLIMLLFLRRNQGFSFTQSRLRASKWSKTGALCKLKATGYCSYKSATHLSMQAFAVEDFIRSSCELPKLNLKVKSIDIAMDPNNVQDEPETSTTETYTQHVEHIVLVDLSVRSFQEIEQLTECIPQWKQFAAKCSARKDDPAKDKFLYSYDMGVTTRDTISFARIPLEMHLKMDLGRRLAGIHADGSEVPNVRTVRVHMVTQFAEYVMDKAMSDAVLSSLQLGRYTMPTFKKKAAEGGNTGSSKEESQVKADGDEKSKSVVTIEFIVPRIPDLTSTTGTAATGGTEPQVDDGKKGEGVTHYGEMDQEKVSALERAMLQAAEQNYGTTIDSSGGSSTDTSSGGSSSSSKDGTPRRGGSGGGGENSFVEAAELEDYLQKAMWINEGTHMTRALASLPPNYLNPGSYSELIKKIVARVNNPTSEDAGNEGKNKIEIDEWSATELKDMGCGAFYAVTQADANYPDRFGRIVRLRYDGTAGGGSGSIKDTLSSLSSLTTTSSITNIASTGGKTLTNDGKRPIVLVGKGVCYDTGGVNVKPAGAMKTMKSDMAGSAAALSTFMALVKSGCESPVECWLALAENNIHPNSYRPDDVVTAVNGVTIEVVHSDAEGRMLLADTLALAARTVTIPAVHASDAQFSSSAATSSGAMFDNKGVLTPKILIDYATLTGSVIASLSTRYVGAFTNKPEYAGEIIATGNSCGERVWPFPCDSDFEEDLNKSDVADILQCLPKGEADHIYATSFLNKFVRSQVPWVHLDLGSAQRPGGLGHVTTEYTGVGVRLAVHLIDKLCR